MNGYFEVLKLRAKEGLLKIVPDLSSETLLQIIQGYVRPNSIIVTDCWRAYSSLQDLELTHYTVNNYLEFRNTETGGHKNNIEGTWSESKKYPHRIRTMRISMDIFLVYLETNEL